MPRLLHDVPNPCAQVAPSAASWMPEGLAAVRTDSRIRGSGSPLRRSSSGSSTGSVSSDTGASTLPQPRSPRTASGIGGVDNAAGAPGAHGQPSRLQRVSSATRTSAERSIAAADAEQQRSSPLRHMSVAGTGPLPGAAGEPDVAQLAQAADGLGPTERAAGLRDALIQQLEHPLSGQAAEALEQLAQLAALREAEAACTATTAQQETRAMAEVGVAPVTVSPGPDSEGISAQLKRCA